MWTLRQDFAKKQGNSTRGLVIITSRNGLRHAHRSFYDKSSFQIETWTKIQAAAHNYEGLSPLVC